MFGALLLFEDEFIHVVAISYTALILTELTMVTSTLMIMTYDYYHYHCFYYPHHDMTNIVIVRWL